MSYYFGSVPQNIALIEKDNYALNTFVESGTYAGETALWAAQHFENVHTIEMQQDYFRMA